MPQHNQPTLLFGYDMLRKRGPFLLSAVIAAIVMFAAIKTVFGQAPPFEAYAIPQWYISPGKWTVPYEAAPSMFSDQCRTAAKCTSFLARVIAVNGTCLRYLNPKVVKDAREIPGHIEEIGAPGEPGWQWSFETDEIFTGAFEWHVTTVDICPKVS